MRRFFGELTASFDGRVVTYAFGELDVLVPAYAATIHKSQGSEYPAVIIPVLTQHYPMLQRNLLYTGVTRGKRLVVLVGQKKAELARSPAPPALIENAILSATHIRGRRTRRPRFSRAASEPWVGAHSV